MHTCVQFKVGDRLLYNSQSKSFKDKGFYELRETERQRETENETNRQTDRQRQREVQPH